MLVSVDAASRSTSCSDVDHVSLTVCASAAPTGTTETSARLRINKTTDTGIGFQRVSPSPPAWGGHLTPDARKARPGRNCLTRWNSLKRWGRPVTSAKMLSLTNCLTTQATFDAGGDLVVPRFEPNCHELFEVEATFEHEWRRDRIVGQYLSTPVVATEICGRGVGVTPQLRSKCPLDRP